MGQGLADDVVNALLGRSILIRYLEDRRVFDSEYLKRFGGSGSFTSLLLSAPNSAYPLFGDLKNRFNGEVFVVDKEERNSVGARHLSELGSFLEGTHVESGQTFFWAYEFDSIPIELISSIYEEFLRPRQKSLGAYYTPPEIVRFTLGQVLPWDREPRAILDPACGSGVFLVEAYRRLVYAWMRSHSGVRPGFETLKDLLLSHIYGVDVNPEAIRVAAFSCYLAMLDFMEAAAVWDSVRLPALTESNLFVGDFFDTKADFNRRKYDVVVGNPPWLAELRGAAADYVADHQLAVGDQQLAQAFIWRTLDILTEDARVGLLLPAKSLLHNSSRPAKRFRQELFVRWQVQSIVDFSLFHQGLFKNALGPMALLIAKAHGLSSSSPEEELTYSAPHPSPLSDSLSGVVLSGDEVHQVRLADAKTDSSIWKIAMWGTARDFALVRRLRSSFPSLMELSDQRKLSIHEGLQLKGTGRMVEPSFKRMRYVPTDAVMPFSVSSDESERLDEEVFHRLAPKQIYRGPHVLLRRGPLRRRRVTAAYLAGDAIFRHTVIGISASQQDAEWLRVLTAILNSSLATYYVFLISGSWGVERGAAELQDYLELPIPQRIGTTAMSRLLQIEEACRERGMTGDLAAALDDSVFSLYDLSGSERQLVEDLIDFGIEQYAQRRGGKPFLPVTTGQLATYGFAVAEVLNATAGSPSQRFRPVIYQGGGSFRLVSIQLSSPDVSEANGLLTRDERQLTDLLKTLEPRLSESWASDLYRRRNVRVFTQDGFHVIKPDEARFWTRSLGYNDADLALLEMLSASEAETVSV
jgi:hypothetical protein